MNRQQISLIVALGLAVGGMWYAAWCCERKKARRAPILPQVARWENEGGRIVSPVVPDKRKTT